MHDYLEEFSSKISSVDKISQRISKEQRGSAAAAWLRPELTCNTSHRRKHQPPTQGGGGGGAAAGWDLHRQQGPPQCWPKRAKPGADGPDCRSSLPRNSP